MNLDFYQSLSHTNNWSALWPELSLVGVALGLLVLELLFKPKHHAAIARIAILSQIVILILLLCLRVRTWELYPQELFGGMLLLTNWGYAMRVFFLLTSLLVCFLATVFFRKHSTLPKIEFYHILLIVTAALMLLVESNHFVMLFVALETVTVGFYVLVSYFRKSPFSLEAGLKFLVMSAVSSCILLFGIALLYGLGGSPNLPHSVPDPLHFQQLAFFIEGNRHEFLVQMATILVVAGLAFKIGAVPFQIWIPDVYQGAPTPVTAFLAVGSKAAGIVVLMNLAIRGGPFEHLQYLLIPVLTAMAMATILFGNLTAIGQHNLKRLMGLSGIAHAGYLLMGVIAGFSVDWLPNLILFYLFAYMLASFAVFGVMVFVSTRDEAPELEDYDAFARTYPSLALVLTIGLGSLAGVPPLVGFLAKLMLFIAAFTAKLYALLVVAIIGVVISFYYYFNWIREATFEGWSLPRLDRTVGTRPPFPTAVKPNTLQRLVLGVLAALCVILGLYLGPIGKFVYF